jgi:hypothetical protein
MQVKLTKAKQSFYLMHTDLAHSTVFKFLDAKLYVKRFRVNPALLMAQNETLKHRALSLYNLTRVELKSIMFSSGAQSLSIDSAVLGRIPKRLLFTVLSTLSRLHGFKPVQFLSLLYDKFLTLCQRQAVPQRGVINGHEP